MRSKVQLALLGAVVGILRPLSALLLKAGISCTEFLEISKHVFVDVATAEFGIRGRPTNVSRVAAMTGLTRKDVKRIRGEASPQRWTPGMEQNPLNVVLHYWHFDPEFSVSQGRPRPLAFEGEGSFSELVRHYVGDIPPGALRAELRRSGILEETGGQLIVSKRYLNATEFHEDFVRNIGFSIKNLVETIEHNATVLRENGRIPEELGRFERVAWTERLSENDVTSFKEWARREGTRFIEGVDNWIGQHEISKEEWAGTDPRTTGVGIYFFEEEKP